ncbi:cell wall hydrolase [Ideonella sp. DXS29W]|uniref:Cell wall hydrolase n=1 Tax=Ideonella lacteola TaxID=2984193 RepID=A0ABU9BVE3_9BURK
MAGTAHLAAERRVRQALNAVLRAEGMGPSLAPQLGLHDDAAQALCWVQHEVSASGAGGPVFTLGFDDSCPSHHLPTHLATLGGERGRISIRAVRSTRFGVAQAWMRAQNLSHPSLRGTLGAVLRHPADASRLLALTAGHVMAADTQTQRDDQAGFFFETGAGGTITGRLIDWQPNFARLPTVTAIDGALAEVSAEALTDLAAHADEWPIGTASPLAGERLRLRTRGFEITGDLPALVSVRLALGEDTTRSYLLEDALCWRTDAPTDEGDSGAPVWNESDELIGIHAGAAPQGSARNAVAVPIGRLLNWAGASLVRRGEPLRRAPAARNAPMPEAVAPAVAPGSAPSDVVTLARTMWGEARGEIGAIDGMCAVAHVVLNRVKRQTYWGRTVAGVCQKPWQFSCWNRNDRNLPQLMAVDATNARFAQALEQADQLITLERTDAARRQRDDPTGGATHYHDARLSPPPRWARGHAPSARIGHHLFFNDIA